jgi:hypothetical protein
MEDSASFDWARYRLSLHQALSTFPHFLRNPIEGMKHLPDWDWPTLLTLQGAFATLCGFTADIITRHFLTAILSFIISPIVAVVVNFILSGFFYYTFMFFFGKHVEFRRIFTQLLFASIPLLLSTLLVPFVPLFQLVGVAAAGLLLIVGFSHNFEFPIKKVRNLISLLFVVYALMLVAQTISTRGGKESLRLRATPESLDILEKELKEDSN